MEPRPQKGITGRPRAILVAVTIIFIIMVLKLWTLQIVNAGKFREMGRSNTVRKVVLKPKRGGILDRNGVPLATNTIRFDASVDYGEIIGDKAARKKLLDTLHDVLGMPMESIERRLEPRRVIPYVLTKIKKDISREEFLQLKILEPDVPGLRPEVKEARDYPYAKLAAHILGYIGAIPADAVNKYKEKGYLPDDIIGIAGIERVYEKELQGKKGRMVVEVDNRNRLVGVIDDSEKPTGGNDIYLTLDLGLQQIAEDALGDLIGAVVIVDPRDGSVLAMVSKPAFDPNIFTIPRSDEDVSRIRQLFTDNENKPIISRAISRPYPLGSAFKVVTALAGLGHENPEKRITRETIFRCGGSFRLGRRPWRCYHGHSHGEMDVVSAIKKSCNVFFYNVGYRAGREALVNMAERLGLGRLSGIELPSERPGVNPTDEWLNSDDWRVPAYTPWVPGFTVNLSIGQYPIEVTPLQVAMAYSVVANGGTLFRPRIVKSISRPYGEVTISPRSSYLEIPDEHLAIVREGLGLVTQRGGTAYRSFKDLQYMRAAGKTSTAEPSRDADWAYTWFIAFAPIDDPEILVVVLVEKGKTGGTTSAPIAAEILKKYFDNHPLPPKEEESDEDPSA